MIGNPRFHRRSYAQCLVNAAEIVAREVEGRAAGRLSSFFDGPGRETDCDWDGPETFAPTGAVPVLSPSGRSNVSIEPNMSSGILTSLSRPSTYCGLVPTDDLLAPVAANVRNRAMGRRRFLARWVSSRRGSARLTDPSARFLQQLLLFEGTNKNVEGPTSFAKYLQV
jgi:hypothetical protein